MRSLTRPTSALRQAAHGAVEALESRVLLTASLPTTVHHSVNAAYTLTGNAGAYTLSLTAGTWTFDADISTAATDWQNLSLQLSSGTQAAFNSPETLAGLNLAATAKVTVSQGTGGINGNLLTLGSTGLSLDPASTLDLTDNDMILQNAGTAGVAQIQSLLHTGYHSGDWQGPGLTSSAAAATATSALPMMLGFGLDSQAYPTYSTFDGVSVSSNDVLVKYTLPGDFTLAGTVSFTALTSLLNYYGATSTTWTQGDSNYDGVTDVTDLGRLLQYYGTQLTGPQYARTLQPTGLTIMPVEGQDFTGLVSTFTDTNTPTTAADYTASIEWGDGIFHPATVTASPTGGFDITGTSPYSLTNPDVLVLALVKYAPTSAYAGRPAALSEPIQIMPAVSDLAATATGPGEIDLAWTLNASNASAIEVDRSPDGVIFTPVTTTLAGSATGYHDTSSTLAEDTHYYYEVRAIQPGGASIFSNVADTFTLAAAPTALTATVGTGEVNLSWTNSSATSPVFDIERSDDGGATFSIIDETAAGATTYADTGIADGTSYLYRVDAVSGDGLGVNSSTSTNPVTVPLAAPTQLSATANGAGEIDLSWTNTSQNATGYIIQRSTDPNGTFNPAGTVSYAEDTSFSDTGLDAATRYYYRVLANSDVVGASSPSNVADAATDPSIGITGNPTVHTGADYLLYASVDLAAGQTDPITGWTINWGDGSTSAPSGDPATFTHPYTQPGDYVVQASPQTANGPLGDVKTQQVSVAVPAPTLSFVNTSLENIQENQSVSLEPIYADDGAGTATSYVVDWGDGSTVQSYGGNAGAFTHAYAHGGTTYTVSAAANTSVGVVAAQAFVSVLGDNPSHATGTDLGSFNVIDFTLITSSTTRLVVGEKDSLQAAFGGCYMAGQGPSVVNYTIDWGDDTTAGTGSMDFLDASASQPAPPHDYERSGQYLVTMAASDGTSQSTWVDVEMGSATLAPIADQTVAAGQAVDVTTTFTGLNPVDVEPGGTGNSPPLAYVDWGDGHGPSPATLTLDSTGTGTISAHLNVGPRLDRSGSITLYDEHGAAITTSFNIHTYHVDLAIDNIVGSDAPTNLPSPPVSLPLDDNLSSDGVTLETELATPDITDPQLIDGSISLCGPAGMTANWNLQFPSSLRVFQVTNNGLAELASGTQSGTVTLSSSPTTLLLKIQGLMAASNISIQAFMNPVTVPNTAPPATQPATSYLTLDATSKGVVTSVNWQTYDPLFDPDPNRPQANNWTSSPLTTSPSGKVTKIFPELKNPDDTAGTARNYVFATAYVSPAIAGQTVYFAFFDAQSTGAITLASNGLNFSGGVTTATTTLNVAAGLQTIPLPAAVVAGLSLDSDLLISTQPAPAAGHLPTYGADTESILITGIDRTNNTITGNFALAHQGIYTLTWTNRGDPAPLIPWQKGPLLPLKTGAIEYLAGLTDATGTARVRFSVTPQPSNDYEVLATPNRYNIFELTQNIADSGPGGASGVAATPTRGAQFPQMAWSNELQVWRTLHLELERMTLAASGPARSLAPYLRLMTTDYKDANVVVANDLARWNSHPTFTGVQTFDALLPGAFDPARAVRDVTNRDNFWVIQMVSAFSNVKPSVSGLAVDPIYIFLQGIQTLYPTLSKTYGPQNLASLAALTQRDVVHESLHMFGLVHAVIPPEKINIFASQNRNNPGDAGLMEYIDLMYSGFDGLTVGQIDQVRGLKRPLDRII